MRLDLEQTWHELRSDGFDLRVTKDGQPVFPTKKRRWNDEEGGFELFKEGIEEGDFSNLAMPRNVFLRSRIETIDFQNTDLSESFMCWDDWVDCDFTDADLSRCDMRASIFTRCRFINTVMTGADLRLSTFESCDVTGAKMDGTVLTLSQREMILLSDSQVSEITWKQRAGAYPGGG